MISLEERMKRYETVSKTFLIHRLPTIIRIDGKTFHTFTRGMCKPWDIHLKTCLLYAAQRLCEHIPGTKLAYWQSDEINLLLTDYDTLETEPWFNNNVQKIVSVSSSIVTASFNQMYKRLFSESSDYKKLAYFDSRVFNLPKEDVCNYFLWRQRDASNNSIQMLSQSQFSLKELHGLNTDQLQDKLFNERNINWDSCETWKKRGACIIYKNKHWIIDEESPIFSKNRDYINQFVYLDEK